MVGRDTAADEGRNGIRNCWPNISEHICDCRQNTELHGHGTHVGCVNLASQSIEVGDALTVGAEFVQSSSGDTKAFSTSTRLSNIAIDCGQLSAV